MWSWGAMLLACQTWADCSMEGPNVFIFSVCCAGPCWNGKCKFFLLVHPMIPVKIGFEACICGGLMSIAG